MTNSLELLLQAINKTANQTEWRSQIAPMIGEYFAAKRAGIFVFEELFLEKRDRPAIWKKALSVEYNPVARYLAERHAPVHEGLVTTPKAWKLICPRQDHRHVMAAPIINQGQIVGVIGCTRDKQMPAFDSEDLIDLGAICLHLSVCMAIDSSPKARLNSDRLTPRELEIAELVALGHNNAEIGKQLWITENSVKQALKRMFRKLQVSSRTEMVARLLKE